MTALLEIRASEDMAVNVLIEVAGLEPGLRDVVTDVMDAAIEALERVWHKLAKNLETTGLSPSDSAASGRTLLRCATINSSSVELIASMNPELQIWKEAHLARLEAI